MANKTKNLRKIGNAVKTEKTVISAPVAKMEKSAATAEKTENKIRVNSFGAAGVRPNRAHAGKSVLGDRKWIFRAVVKSGDKITYADTVPFVDKKSAQPVAFDTPADALAMAGKIRANNPDVVNARTYPRGGKYALWIAFAVDNGKMTPA